MVAREVILNFPDTNNPFVVGNEASEKQSGAVKTGFKKDEVKELILYYPAVIERFQMTFEDIEHKQQDNAEVVLLLNKPDYTTKELCGTHQLICKTNVQYPIIVLSHPMIQATIKW